MFFAGYLENGVIVREPRRLWIKYRTSRKFKLDVFSILPTDFIFIATGQQVPWAIIRINRLLRLPRLTEFIYRAGTRVDYPIFLRIAVLVSLTLRRLTPSACLFVK